MKKIEVVAAVILNNNQILSVQRAKHKFEYISEKYEFPGGKIEANETKEEALQRELKEELDLSANIGNHFITIDYQYPDFELKMHTYWVHTNSKEVSLNEHISKRWLNKNELDDVEWAAADIPIVEKLKTEDWEIL